MLIERKSMISGKIRKLEINVTEDQYQRWIGGELIQDVMPNLSAADREFIMAGITDEEWKEAFGGREPE